MKPLAEAIKDVKQLATANFDETIEVHINLTTDVKQADQQLRTTVSLPHGTGKETKVAVLSSKEVKDADLNLSEDDITKLEKGKITPGKDFDILVVEPSYMAKIGRLGPVLGPAGVMPNPKTGTVTDDVEKAVSQFKKGKIELRNEPNAPIIHTIIGKLSFEDKKLIENFNEIWATLKSNKPQKAKPNWIKNIFIVSTMGDSVEVDINAL